MEQQYFAEGMAEDIIAALSQISSLSLVARNSSFAYRDRSVKVQDIASDLGVGYILEGSVRKSGNRTRSRRSGSQGSSGFDVNV